MYYPAYTSPFLTDIPEMLDEDHAKVIDSDESDLPTLVMLYEGLHKSYNHHPFFTVRLAELFFSMNAQSLAVVYLREAKLTLDDMGADSDNVLDDTLLRRAVQVHQQVGSDARMAHLLDFHRPWRRSSLHKYPSKLSITQGHDNGLHGWASAGSAVYERYLRVFAIETNHIENVFLLTEESAQDIIWHGIADGIVNPDPSSSVRDPEKIKRILNDTLAAYDIVHEVMEQKQPLSRALVCDIHAKLMYTCRFTEDNRYIAAGETRTVTSMTVVVRGEHLIECCPFDTVDRELDYICRVANEHIVTCPDPFAAASWFHLILIRCHPFEDGNGRLTRILASLPLIMRGCPPISISQHIIPDVPDEKLQNKMESESK